MRDDLENIYLLLFRERLPAGALQRGLATWESVVLVPGPVVFAPSLVLLGRAAGKRHRGHKLCFGSLEGFSADIQGDAREKCPSARHGCETFTYGDVYRSKKVTPASRSRSARPPSQPRLHHLLSSTCPISMFRTSPLERLLQLVFLRFLVIWLL